jgi:hypothetical protein
MFGECSTFERTERRKTDLRKIKENVDSIPPFLNSMAIIIPNLPRNAM